MPIVDLEWVGGPNDGPQEAAALAKLLGETLGSAPGRTWLRLRPLAPERYAEDSPDPPPAPGPVFVTVMMARWPAIQARRTLAQRLTQTVADHLGRDATCVHVQFAPEGAGRQAFGGQLIE